MLTPAFWCTILVTNHAIEKYNVPREIFCVSTAGIDFVAMTKEELMQIASPREKKNGEIFYLSNGIVSWLNNDIVDYEDISLTWEDEINMLKEHGLKFGRDMIRVQWPYENNLYTCDDSQHLMECDWVRMIEVKRIWESEEALDKASGDINECALLWVDERKIFKGYNTMIIKHE